MEEMTLVVHIMLKMCIFNGSLNSINVGDIYVHFSENKMYRKAVYSENMNDVKIVEADHNQLQTV